MASNKEEAYNIKVANSSITGRFQLTSLGNN